jgi:hypothetical protein
MMKRLRYSFIPKELRLISYSFPGELAGQIIQSRMQKIYESKDDNGKFYALSGKDMQDIIYLVNSLWRAKKKLLDILNKSGENKEAKKVLRNVESAIDSAENMGIKIVDYIGQQYAPGMAVNVISSQPNNAIDKDRVCETLKPTIYFRDSFVQSGDVIIEGPMLRGPDKN